jgi:Tol biopolymer transport system component
MIGRTLAHYRITAAIGAGGMGEVYRAVDTNLNREVAIKVLPPEVAGDPERLARFRREAHLLASLNHQNIAAIYGLEDADGRPFLVLELVEGKEVKERLSKGALPVKEALEIAEQIAEALEEAHSKGIVHRDLKPANVKLTPDGNVKVLDFGLAKAWGGDGTDVNSRAGAMSQSPTLAHTGTAAGLILGTAAYMSPEQARGKHVDKRSDVWSFGVLLYEMLTGRDLFAGDTVTDVIAAVVTKEPDLDALPAATPRAVRRLIARCLRKDPRTRLPDIGAARLELQDVLAGTATEVDATASAAGETAQTEHPSRNRERWVWAALVLVLAGVSSFFVLQRWTETPRIRPTAHFVLDTPEDLSLGDFLPSAVSPDGRSIVFVGVPSGGTPQLWMRPLDAPELRVIPGTESAEAPFWSPDSTSIAFVAEGELRKLTLATRTVQRICTLPQTDFNGGTWNGEGTIVFSCGGATASLYSVSAAGGEARLLMPHNQSRGETGHFDPQFLPDGRHLLFVVWSSENENSGLYVTSLQAPDERQRILPNQVRSLYTGPGNLLFVREGILLAQPFDAKRLVTAGEPVSVASGVGSWAVDPNEGFFSVSMTGVVNWVSGAARDVQLEWLDRKGERLGTLGEVASYGQIALSPDDRRVAAEVAGPEGRFDLWLIDVSRGVASRLTSDPANERDPVWSPDGQKLVYSSDEKGEQNLLLRTLQGGEAAAPLPGGAGATPGERDIAECWTSKGDTLVYMTLGVERTLWALPMDGSGPAKSLKKDRFGLDEPHVSPDGRWLAFISTESGRYEVYIEPFRSRGERVRVSASGGGQPKWRGDGKELFFLDLNGALMAVDVHEGKAGLQVGIPTMLVSAGRLRAVVEGPDFDDYAVTADGRHFLVKRHGEKNEKPRIHVLVNWPPR